MTPLLGTANWIAQVTARSGGYYRLASVPHHAEYPELSLNTADGTETVKQSGG